jgi:hypothetical protein
MSATNIVMVPREVTTSPPERPAPLIESYATLINKKILLPSQKTNYIAAETHFLVVALRSRIEQIFVDEAWYLAKYPDIQSAISSGVVKSAREHYALHGFYEHRLPYAIDVDEAWYLAQYQDIRNAVFEGTFPTGQAHFEKLGYREGRLPFADFHLKSV